MVAINSDVSQKQHTFRKVIIPFEDFWSVSISSGHMRNHPAALRFPENELTIVTDRLNLPEDTLPDSGLIRTRPVAENPGATKPIAVIPTRTERHRT
jgi:hypothetical protein